MWRERTVLETWERMAAPVAGEGVVCKVEPEECPPGPALVPLLTSGTTAIEAVRVTSVVSGDCGLRVMVP